MITAMIRTNLASLGEERDRADAAALLADLTAFRNETLVRPLHRQRKAFHRWWDWERQGRQWRPLTVPWSAAARALYEADPAVALNSRLGSGLVTEHVVPIKVIVALLLEGEQTVDAYLTVLRAVCLLSVITKHEDALLSAAGLLHRHPDPYDPWLRYHVAGLDVDGFALP